MTDETGWHTRQLQAALRARGALGAASTWPIAASTPRAAWHGLVIPASAATLPDAALVRGIAGGSFEQVTKRLGVLHALRELGVPVYNDARAIERSVDKSMTSLLLHAAGVPTPPTWATESPAQAQRIVMRESAAGHALVLKPLFGSQGKGLQLVGAGRRRAPRRCRRLGRRLRLAGLPAALRAAADRARLRLARAGGRRPRASPRCAASARTGSTTWRRARAASRPTLTPDAGAHWPKRAARALDMDYAGVDLMPAPPTHGTLQVIEVNGVAAWQGLQRVTGFNIARAHRRRPARPQAGARALRARAPSAHVSLRAAAARAQAASCAPARSTSRCASRATSAAVRPGTACMAGAVHRQRAGRRPGRCSSRARASASASRPRWRRQLGGGRLQHQPGHRAAVRADRRGPSSCGPTPTSAGSTARSASQAVLAELDLADAQRRLPRDRAGPPRRPRARRRSEDVRSAAEHRPARRDGAGRRRATASRASTANGYADLFDSASCCQLGFRRCGALHGARPPTPAPPTRVQRLYLALLAGWPDSHIVRKHGAAVAHIVMRCGAGAGSARGAPASSTPIRPSRPWDAIAEGRPASTRAPPPI